MKKKLLAAGVAAAFGIMAAPASASWGVSHDGIGHINIIPYYSVQGSNVTNLSITNTDTKNGKVVKVRFRGAQWSDDVFDFTLFLSPGDMWTGALTKTVNAAGEAVAALTTVDTSCTLPANIKISFPTVRLDADSKDGGSLEGYVEVITEGDIPKYLYTDTGIAGATIASNLNPLFTATKHGPDGAAPPCRDATKPEQQALLGNLVADAPWEWTVVAPSPVTTEKVTALSTNGVGYYSGTTDATANTTLVISQKPSTSHPQFGVSAVSTTDDWIVNATASLTSYITIIDVAASKAVTVPATAVSNYSIGNAKTSTVKRFFRQRSEEPSFSYALGDLTADRIFADSGERKGGYGTELPLYEYDLPDLSTPYDINIGGLGTVTAAAPYWYTPGTAETDGKYYNAQGGAAAFVARDELASALESAYVITEYVTDDNLLAETDVVIAQPLRRFFYQYKTALTNPHRTYNWTGKGEEGVHVYGDKFTAYAALNGASNSLVSAGGAEYRGREEQSQTVRDGEDVVSPGIPDQPKEVGLKGEVSVLAINALSIPAHGSDVLGAKLTAYGVPFEYSDGWAIISTSTYGTAASGSTGGFQPFSESPTQPASGGPLPVRGFTAVNLHNGNSSAGIASNYGQFLPLRYVK